jgi:hypothetical protein
MQWRAAQTPAGRVSIRPEDAEDADVTPEVRAAIEGMATLASGIVLVLVSASIMMMRNVSQAARCRWCEHCRREEDEERVRRAGARHESYHRLTDGAASVCHRDDCPGRS